MTYEETLEYIYSQVPMFQNRGAGAYKPGLDTTRRLAEAWGNPEKALRCIHIAGTNGKGSTASLIAAVLQSAGYRTGLYTSPHLLDFGERIRVDGKMIDRDFVVRFVEEYLADENLTALKPSFFELTTIMAFKWFEESRVDVAVIETGLGGRLDCTNIINPDLSIITNISLDHMALLGNTEEAIAVEKAGIIKPGVPVVIGRAEGEVLKVFEIKASEEHAPLVLASEQECFTDVRHAPQDMEYSETEWGTISGELTGACQVENARTVLTALHILAKDFPAISAQAVANGFAHVCELTGLAGRWMEVSSHPVRVICDTGHNIGGWEWLGKSLEEIANSGKLAMVIGFVNDKDLSSVMECMPRNAKYYFVSPSVERGRQAESTASIGAEHGLLGNAYPTVAEGFAAAKADAEEGSTIFVGGSTFVVADFLKIICNHFHEQR